MFRIGQQEHSQSEDAFFGFISKRIREARAERGMSQQELAHFLYKTGKAVSDIERGRVHVSLFDLSLIARSLDKPISYFFPPFLTQGSEDDLTPDERELLLFYRKIWDGKLRAVALQQVRGIAEVDIKDYIEEERREYEEFRARKDERKIQVR